MCDCDDNPPTIYRHATVRGRKSYRCYECRRAIDKGEAHDVHSGLWDGEFNTFRWCAHCVAAQRVYEAISGDHCYCFGTLWEGIGESRGWGERHDPRISRLIAGSRRKWRHRRGKDRGQLMPVPVLAPAGDAAILAEARS